MPLPDFQYPAVDDLNAPPYGLPVPETYPFAFPEELPRSDVNPALAASRVAFSGAGRLIGVTITNTKASSQFVQLFDSSTVPADTAVPILAVPIPAGSVVALFWDVPGRWMDRGCAWSNSSTQGTKTIGSADCLFDTQYVPQVI